MFPLPVLRIEGWLYLSNVSNRKTCVWERVCVCIYRKYFSNIVGILRQAVSVSKAAHYGPTVADSQLPRLVVWASLGQMELGLLARGFFAVRYKINENSKHDEMYRHIKRWGDTDNLYHPYILLPKSHHEQIFKDFLQEWVRECRQWLLYLSLQDIHTCTPLSLQEEDIYTIFKIFGLYTPFRHSLGIIDGQKEAVHRVCTSSGDDGYLRELCLVLY